MSGFDDHNVTHSSPSQINTWTNAPDVWVTEKLFLKRSGMSPAAWRGIVIEDGVAAVFRGASVEDATKDSLAKFDHQFNTSGTASLKAMAATDNQNAKAEKERPMIAPAIGHALDALKHLGTPDMPAQGQHKIEIKCQTDKFTLPIIGFLDFVFPEHGLVVDLKTTGRIPGIMSIEHQRQRAIYAKARGNQQVKFLYVSGKKAEWREDGDVDELLANCKQILIRQEAFLSLGDKELLRQVVPVNPGTFYWSGNSAARNELFGL
jgi:hypothetical protein